MAPVGVAGLADRWPNRGGDGLTRDIEALEPLSATIAREPMEVETALTRACMAMARSRAPSMPSSCVTSISVAP